MANQKLFAERLNQCLDETGAPANMRERSVILAKMLDISKQQAWGLLEGQIAPNEEILDKIVTEFEVELDWIKGTS